MCLGLRDGWILGMKIGVQALTWLICHIEMFFTIFCFVVLHFRTSSFEITDYCVRIVDLWIIDWLSGALSWVCGLIRVLRSSLAYYGAFNEFNYRFGLPLEASPPAQKKAV